MSHQIIVDSYVQNKSKNKSKIPKSLIGFLLGIVILIGLNFGVIKLLNKKIRPLVNIICVAMCFTSIAILIFPVNSSDKDIFYWHYIHVIQYVCHLLVLLSTKYTTCDFIHDIHNILLKIDGEGSSVFNANFGIVALTSSFLIFVLKMGLCVLQCFYDNIKRYCDRSSIPLYIYCIPSLGLDIVWVVLVLMVYYMYSSVKSLRRSMEHQNLKAIQNYYVEISNCCDKVKPLYTKMFITELIITAPKLTGTLWYILYFIKMKVNWFTFLYGVFYVFHLICQICSPPIVAEMINSEMQSIKLILINKLAMEKDEKKCEEISRLLTYLNARPLLSDVCGVIPLDLRLSVTLVSFCLTYLIVFINFTKLFE